MTQDEIIQMAIENTINGLNFNQEGLVRFANLVAAKEKEACAEPQRTWVGLTNYEVNNIAAGCHLGNSVQDAIFRAEAKLKQKNGFAEEKNT
jgi:hypothetical protein